MVIILIEQIFLHGKAAILYLTNSQNMSAQAYHHTYCKGKWCNELHTKHPPVD